MEKGNVLDKVELFATRIISHELSDKMVFHDIKRTHKVVKGAEEIIEHESLTDQEEEIVLIAAWMIHTGFVDVHQLEERKIMGNTLLSYCITCSKQIAESFLSSIKYPEEKIKLVLQTMENTDLNATDKNLMDQVLGDALYCSFGKKNAKKELKLMYEENLLVGIVSISKGSWYEIALEYLEKYHYLTDYGKKHFEPEKQALIIKLKKEHKNIEKQKDLVLKKELDISEIELKTLKKDLEKQKGRDDKGIQTMFRITSRNHYTLNAMVDRKANIMISVNSIILSLILGVLLSGQIMLEKIDFIPTILMLSTSILSIIFAIFSIRPTTTHGEFTEEEIRNKNGNLLYYGNFHDMHPRDFEWGMLQMLSDRNYLYTTMIRDFYYLGQTINRKHKNIRKSLNFFTVGLALTTFITIVIKIVQSFVN